VLAEVAAAAFSAFALQLLVPAEAAAAAFYAKPLGLPVRAFSLLPCRPRLLRRQLGCGAWVVHVRQSTQSLLGLAAAAFSTPVLPLPVLAEAAAAAFAA